ncbi:MAG TPA: polysaccharide deacetylase family protein [bacterium]|nr:polysaccharide deacetylase family protein [bacterium]
MWRRQTAANRAHLVLLAAALAMATVGAAPAIWDAPAAWAGAAAGGRWRVPVLMYHMVDTDAPSHDLLTLHLTVMAPAFEDQIKLLRHAGYRPLSLDDVWAAAGGRTPPARGVVLTFDDGYEDNYRVAFPILKKYGWTGTFFVVTSTIGTRGHMTPAQLAEMARAGMAIESHGQHHIDFSQLSLGAARTELSRSKQIIAGWSGRPVAFFAYPAGRFTPALEGLLGDLGYHGAVTEIPGFVTPASRPFALERVRVDHDDSLASFARKLDIPLP